jgi:hypothetical protein
MHEHHASTLTTQTPGWKCSLLQKRYSFLVGALESLQAGKPWNRLYLRGILDVAVTLGQYRPPFPTAAARPVARPRAPGRDRRL